MSFETKLLSFFEQHPNEAFTPRQISIYFNDPRNESFISPAFVFNTLKNLSSRENSELIYLGNGHENYSEMYACRKTFGVHNACS